MSERPEPSAPPFRITVHGTDGRAREFPLYADAAYDNVERALFWRDRPFSGEIMDQLDDREVLLLANVRLYSKLMTRSDATFHFTDDMGHAWGLPAHAVVAVEIHDPEAGDRDRPRIGFQFGAADTADNLPTNVVPLRPKPYDPGRRPSRCHD